MSFTRMSLIFRLEYIWNVNILTRTNDITTIHKMRKYLFKEKIIINISFNK